MIKNILLSTLLTVSAILSPISVLADEEEAVIETQSNLGNTKVVDSYAALFEALSNHEPVIGLSQDIVLENALTIDYPVTLIAQKPDGSPAKLTRAAGYTKGFFHIKAPFTLIGVDIDAGSDFIISNQFDKKLAAELESGSIQTGNFIQEGNGLVSTDNLIKIQNGGSLVLDGSVIENAYFKTNHSLIKVENSAAAKPVNADQLKENAQIKIINGSVIQHNAKTHGSIIATQNGSSIYLENATLQNNYAQGNGGLFDLRDGSMMLIDGGQILNNKTYNGNGSLIQVYESELILNNGLIEGNQGLKGPNGIHSQPIYVHRNGSFIMNGGEITGNTSGVLYQRVNTDTSLWDAFVELNGGSIHDNSYYLKDQIVKPDRLYDDNFSGEVFLSGNAKINGTQIKGDIILHGQAKAEISKNAIIDGNLFAKAEIDTSGAIEKYGKPAAGNFFESSHFGSVNKGVIAGDVYAENTAPFINENEIDGSLVIVPVDSQDKNHTNGIVSTKGVVNGMIALHQNGRFKFNDSLFTTGDGASLKQLDDSLMLSPAGGVSGSTNSSKGLPTIMDICGNVLKGSGTKAADFGYSALSSITINKSQNGSVSLEENNWPGIDMNHPQATQGTKVVLTVNPGDGYDLDSLIVKQGDKEIEVKDNSFVMPAGDVIVSTSFKKTELTGNPDQSDSGSLDSSDEHNEKKTITNSDGSITEKVVDAKGNATETTTNFPQSSPLAGRSVYTEKTSGIVTTSSQQKDGTLSIIKASPKGAVAGNIKLGSVSDGSIVIPAIPANHTKNDVRLQIELANGIKTISFNVMDENPGSVVLMNGKVLTDANVKNGVMSVTLPGSGIITIEDMSMVFPDLGNYDKTTYPGSGIAYTSARGIMTGQENGTFDLNGKVTRGMIARILYNMAGNPDVTGYPIPTGVGDNWYTDAASWAVHNKLMAQGSNFRGDELLTREQLAMILWRYEKNPTPYGDMSQYNLLDLATISTPEMASAVRWAVGEKIIGQGSDIAAQKEGTRGEIANMLYRYLTKE